MKKVIIIGAGISGMICAINAKTSKNEVILLEKDNQVGKKILVTGAGRCNYYHDDISIDNYHSTDLNLLSKFIVNMEDSLNFFNNIGIVPYIKDGYYYPSTKDANTIRDVLLEECINRGIIIKTEFVVNDIEINNNKITVSSDKEKINGNYLVIASGSKSYYKDTNSYELLNKLNVKVNDPLPSLVQLFSKEENYLKKWSGVRTTAKVSLYEDNKFIKSEVGELQLIDYGISGICVFNLTPYITRGLNDNKTEEVIIDFIPFMNDEELLDYFYKYNSRTIDKCLKTILNKKLVNIITQINKLQNKYIGDLNKEEKDSLIKLIKEFKVTITKTKDFKSSQITAGGLSLTELNEDYSLIKNNNIFVIGELVDIDGDCGGYNIAFATKSGIVSGKSIKRRCNDD